MDVAEYVDRVVSTDYNARGVVSFLYPAVRRLFDEPLCLNAAERLSDAEMVLIITGFRILRFNGRLETDGPFSTSLLAACFERFFGSKVVVVTDEGFEEVLKAGLQAAGSASLNVYGLPKDLEKCMEFGEGIVDEGLDCVVSVERPAANEFNRYHNMVGEDITNVHAPLDLLANKLRKKNIPLIAYADGGNELGMGLIKETVKRYVPYGAACKCGCSGGIASNIESDHLVVSSFSDLGVFGTLALTGQQTITYVVKRVDAVLKELVEAGCVDSRKGPNYLGIDGVDINGIRSIVHMLSMVSRSDAPRL